MTKKDVRLAALSALVHAFPDNLEHWPCSRKSETLDVIVQRVFSEDYIAGGEPLPEKVFLKLFESAFGGALILKRMDGLECPPPDGEISTEILEAVDDAVSAAIQVCEL